MGPSTSVSRPRAGLMMTMGMIECLLFGFIVDGWPSLEYIFKNDGVFAYLCQPDSAGFDTYGTAHDVGNGTWSSTLPENRYAGINSTNVISSRSGLDAFNIVNETYENTQNSPQLLRGMWLNGTTGFSNASRRGCDAQNDILNSAYVVSSIIGQCMSVLLGFIFDRFGLRISRIFSTVCFLIGVFMMTFNNLANSWLIFPGLLLISVSSMMVIICAMHVGLVAGSRQSTYLAMISAFIDVSIFVPMVMQLAYDAGMSRQLCFYLYAALWIIHILNTIFLSPADKLYNETVSTTSSKEALVKSTTDSDHESSTTMDNMAFTVPPFKAYALSPLYVLYTLWYAVIQLHYIFIVGAYNVWLEILTGGNQLEVDWFTLIFQFLQVGALVISPLVGLLLDWSIGRSSRNKNNTDKEDSCLIPTDAKEPTTGYSDVDSTWTRAGPMLPAICVTEISSLGLSISALFWSYNATYAISFFNIALKSALFAVNFAFIQQVYPPEHQGKSFGLLISVGCFLNLAEVPLFQWAETSNPPFNGANITLLVLSLVTMAFPVVIWLKNRSGCRGGSGTYPFVCGCL